MPDMLIAIGGGTLALAAIGLVVALLLGRSAARLSPDESSAVAAINRLLPQTQCAQCGYPGCRPYAEAVSTGAAINKCPPGGDATVHALAELLGREVIPLEMEKSEDRVAVIDEPACIGCTLCIQACPVDAIIGAPQKMHTVIESECTGCELCIEPCPVDCIDLVPLKNPQTYPARTTAPEVPVACIRCGQCEDVCPRDLLPQELFWFRESRGKLAELDIDRCIECQLCDRTCPSLIPLTAIFKQAKHDIAAEDAKRLEAQHAEARYEQRLARLASDTNKVRRRPSPDERASLIKNIRQAR